MNDTMPTWTAVDSPPPSGARVIVSSVSVFPPWGKRRVDIDTYRPSERGFAWSVEDTFLTLRKVTHWMPLPNAPEILK